MRYRLRSLLILLAVGPLLVAWWLLGDLDTLRFGKPMPVRGRMQRDNQTCELQSIVAFQRGLPDKTNPTTVVFASCETLDPALLRRMARDAAGDPTPLDEVWVPEPFLRISFRPTGELVSFVVWNRSYGSKGYTGKIRIEGNRIHGRARWKHEYGDGSFDIAFDTTIEQF